MSSFKLQNACLLANLHQLLHNGLSIEYHCSLSKPLRSGLSKPFCSGLVRFASQWFTQTTSWQFGDLHLSGLPLSSHNDLPKPLLGSLVNCLSAVWAILSSVGLLSPITVLDKMAEENVPAPTRTDNQLVLVKTRLHTGKSNLLMDLQKMQKHLIFCISMDILHNTNLFRAFITSAYNALEITLKGSAYPFVSPLAGDLVTNIVNNLGYPEELQIVSKMHANNLYQSWRIILSMINQCLTEYYKKYLEMVARKPRQPTTMTGEEVKKKKKAPKAGMTKQHAPAKQLKPAKKKTTNPSPSKKIHKGKRSDHLVDEKNDESQPAFEPQVKDDEYNLQRGNQMSLESLQAPIGRVVAREPDQGFIRKLLDVEGIRKGEEVSNTVALEERNIELDEGQARLDHGKTLESRPLPERKFMEEDQAGSDPGQRTSPHIESYKLIRDSFINEESGDAFTFGDQFLNDKSMKEEPRKANVETKVESMVTVPIHQASLLVHPLSTPNIDLSPPKPVLPHVQEPIFTTTTLPPPPLPPQSTTDPDLATRITSGSYNSVFLYLGLTLRKTKDGRARTNILMKALMNYAIPDTYVKSLAWKTFDLREAPSSSSKQKHASPSEKPINDDPILVDMHLSEAHDTGVAHLLKIKTRLDWLNPLPKEEIPEIPKPDWVIPPNDLPETENNWADALAKTYKDPKENKVLQKTRDIASFIKWYCKQIGKKKLIKADFEGQGNRFVHEVSKPLPLGGPPGQVTIEGQYFFSKGLEYLVFGNKERRHALSISKLKATYYLDFGLKELIPSLWTESESAYDVSSAYNISHRWFKHKEFYITRNSAPFDHNAVRSHMKILSVVSLKTFFKYGYKFLKEIVLRRADYKEYKISKSDFKNLYLSDFEDMYLLNLQGKLNHSSRANKVYLSIVVNLWTRNIVIRQRVEDLQLSIKSYQTKLNITQPR
nr:hypothetical protein [Tanacetum cinerariifolium]